MLIDRLRKRYKQAKTINFSGLRWNTITPTDIDAYLNFSNKLIILLEYKLSCVEMKRGQKIALENLCDSIQKSGISCYLILCDHDKYNTNDDIMASEALVIGIRYKNKWLDMTNKTVATAKMIIDIILLNEKIYTKEEINEMV